jgi:hypothetical protein
LLTFIIREQTLSNTRRRWQGIAKVDRIVCIGKTASQKQYGASRKALAYRFQYMSHITSTNKQISEFC